MKPGGTHKYFSGSVANRGTGADLRRCLFKTFLFVAAFCLGHGSNAHVHAADGDPPLEVPTLHQGRVLLARDMLHQQCEKARLAKDWEQLARLAEQALTEEQTAFGSEFGGSFLTMSFRDTAHVFLGKKTLSVQRAEQGFSDMDDQFRANFLEEFGEKLPLHMQKELESTTNKYIESLEAKSTITAELLVAMQKALVTNDYADADQKIQAAYVVFKKVFEDLRSQGTDADDPLTDGAVTDDYALMSMLHSQAKQRSGDRDESRDLARQAFSLVKKSNPFWEFDSRPMIGGRAIGQNLLDLLNADLGYQRLAGDWESATRTADEMMPIARKLWDHPENLSVMRAEAKRLSELSESDQERYANTIEQQVEFQSAYRERRFHNAIEVGVAVVDARIGILGPDCVEAARINRKLGYLFWTQGDYDEAFKRLADAALVFAKHLPADDEWLKAAMSDLYVNATLSAQSGPQSSDPVSQLETVVDSLATLLTEKHFGVAEGRLCLLGVRRLQEMSEEEHTAHSVLSAEAARRSELYSTGQFAEAAKIGMTLIEQAKQLFGEPSAQHLNHLREYANCLAKSGKAELSLAVYRDLLTQYDTPPSNRTSDFCWVYHGMANTLRTLGGRQNNVEAIKWIAKARALAADTHGKQSFAYANHLTLEGEILRDQLGAPAKALSKLQQANSIYEVSYGNQDNLGYCQGLVQVGLCQNQLRLWEAADQHLKRSLEIRKRNDFDNPYMMAWNLWALGRNAFGQRNFAEAVEYFSRTLAVKEQETPNANDISSVYGQLLAASTLTGRDEDDSRQVLQQFLDRRGMIHRDNPERFADECRDAAQWLFDSPGEVLRGEMTKERQALLEKLVSVGHRAYAVANVLGDRRILDLEIMLGRASEMLDERERAFVIFRSVLEQAQSLENPPHGLIGSVHIGLSNLHKSEFALDRTLHHRRLAREALEQEFGENSFRVADVLKGEADTLLALGDYSRAEELAQRAADIFSELGHPMQAEVYQQLAEIHWRRADYDRAEQYLYAARAHLNEIGSHEKLDFRIRLWLAKIMLAKGEFSLALETSNQLIESASDSSGAQLTSSARSVQGIARLGLGEAQEALQTFKEVIAETDRSSLLHVSHETRAAYAAACERVGNRQEASRQFRLLIDDLTEQHKRFGTVLSERQKLELRSKLNYALSAYISHVIETDESLVDCYERIMPLKGLVSAGQRRQHGPGAAPSPEMLELSRQIDKINQELSSLLFGNTVSDHKQSIERIGQLTEQREILELKRDALQKGIGDRSVRLVSEASLEQLQKSLNQDESLIDFVTYAHHDRPGLPDSTSQECLLAFVVTKSELHAVPLGAADELRTLVTRWRETLRDASDKEFGVANRELAARIWDPVKEQVGEAGIVLLSPDGLLSKVSFAAFPTGDERYLVDKHTFITVSAPRLLVRTRAAEAALEWPGLDEGDQNKLLLVGGVNYDAHANGSKGVDSSSSLVASISTGSATSGTALRSASSVTNWNYLPGTEAEVRQIASLAKNAQVASSTVTLGGENASEAALAELAGGARWMHLATHGFFAESKSDSDGWAFQSLSRQSVVGFDPRLLTGIVLSGANQPAEAGRDDGILTAAEIERLDLSHTELVVLSACETALGEGRSGEGVLGLQRSLHLAGCDHVVASLWKVDDQATASLMTEFYRQLWQEDKTPAEALRPAQQQLSRAHFENGRIVRGDSRINFGSPRRSQGSDQRLSPRFWAAFCVSIN